MNTDAAPFFGANKPKMKPLPPNLLISHDAEAVTLNWLVTPYCLGDGSYFFQANVAARARLTKLKFLVFPSPRCGLRYMSRVSATGPHGGCHYRYLGRYMTPADAQRACEAHYSNIATREVPRRPGGRRARPEETWTLNEFLAARGGLDPNDRRPSDVRASIGRSNKFIPGFGPLIRRNGMSLDRAREAAVEAGYLYDLGAISGAQAATRVTDLVDAVDREFRRERPIATADCRT